MNDYTCNGYLRTEPIRHGKIHIGGEGCVGKKIYVEQVDIIIDKPLNVMTGFQIMLAAGTENWLVPFSRFKELDDGQERRHYQHVLPELFGGPIIILPLVRYQFIMNQLTGTGTLVLSGKVFVIK